MRRRGHNAVQQKDRRCERRGGRWGEELPPRKGPASVLRRAPQRPRRNEHCLPLRYRARRISATESAGWPDPGTGQGALQKPPWTFLRKLRRWWTKVMTRARNRIRRRWWIYFDWMAGW